MSVTLHYSGAIEPWGLTFPFFSRGRYVSRLELPLYDVGALFPGMSTGGSYRYRCLFAKAVEGGNITLTISGPFPSVRSEVMEVALGAQSPTTFVPYLSDETQAPNVFSEWRKTVSFALQPGQTFPLWFRLYIPTTARPTNGAWFVISVNGTVASHIIYTYKESYTMLPLQLWADVRKAWVFSDSSFPVASQNPPSTYEPAGWRWSSPFTVLVQYPVAAGFEESSFSKRLVKIVAGAIGEFWRRADALAGFHQEWAFVSGDAAVRLAFPVDVEGDAVVNLCGRFDSLKGDALVNFAKDLVEVVSDSLAVFGKDYLAVRGDAMLYLGYERLLRGDVLTFIAKRLETKLGDAQVLFSSVDDILGLPGGAASYYGFSVIPGLSWLNLRQPFTPAQLYATDLGGSGRLRVLEEVQSGLWRVVGTIDVYPSVSRFVVNSRTVRIRNDGDSWGLVAWAFVSA